MKGVSMLYFIVALILMAIICYLGLVYLAIEYKNAD